MTVKKLFEGDWCRCFYRGKEVKSIYARPGNKYDIELIDGFVYHDVPGSTMLEKC